MFVLVRHPFSFLLDSLLTRKVTRLPAKEDELHCSLSSSRLSLHVDLHYFGDDEVDNPPVGPGFVMAANELGILCWILVTLDHEFPGHLPRLNLKLGIFPRYQLVANASAITGSSSLLDWKSRPFPQQRMLLEPFSTLYSVTNFEIASMDGETERLDAQLMKDVKERAGRPPPSMEEVTIATTKIEDDGNEAFRAGDFLHACVLYRSARDNLHSWNNYFHRVTIVVSAEFYKGDRAHIYLGLRIRSSLVAALLRLQLWGEAHGTASEVLWEIVDIRGFRSGPYYDLSDLAKLYYLKALASEGLGKLTQADKDIHEAMLCDPDNTEFRATLEKWTKSAK